MTQRTRIVLVSVLLFAAADAAAEEPAAFHHLPPAQALNGQPLILEAQIERAWAATIEIRFRAIGDATWRAATFQRGAEDAYRVTVPADAVRAPGFEYYIVGTATGGQTSEHFASAHDPHRVAVHEDETTIQRKEELARVHGRRARARVSTEYVDFGARDFGAVGDVADFYYRIDADFTYRLLRFPLYQLRFGFMRLRGETPVTERGGECAAGMECAQDAGIDAGWFEVRLRAHPLVELDLRGMLTATRESFNPGGRVEARIGPETGSHVALGAEYLADTGSAAFLRLGWDTVPRFPMAATIELTDFPSSHRAAAVRLIYDVAYPMDDGFRIGGRVGYQARDQRIGGVSGGVNVSLDF